MANPTTNYGFVMPTSTDLVTDLPADFDVFGQAVDTQMLTNANAAIAKSIVDAKGDIIAATAADTVSRLAVGANGTVLTADSTAATGLKWASVAAGGKLLQVVQGTTTTPTTINSTTMTDTSLTATITPTLSTSKILVMTAISYYMDRGSNQKGCQMRLVRGATTIFDDGTNTHGSGYIFVTGAADVALGNRVGFNYLDSPATTSATTYKVQAASDNAAGTFLLQQLNATSSIILMEIGA